MNKNRFLLLCALFGGLLGFGFQHTYSQPAFTEVALSVGIDQKSHNRADMAGASAWFDYDRDGDEDLFTTGGNNGNHLYRNDGNGSFTNVTAAAGIHIPVGVTTQGIVTGDIDNDGYREVFIGTWWEQPNYLFHNNGDGTFTDISVSSGLGVDSMWTSAAAFGDIDRDGLLDLYTGNYVWEPEITMDSLGNQTGFAHRCNGNSLWYNNGDGTFTDIAPQFAVNDTGCALAAIFTDFDKDGDPDIWVANDFGAWVSPNVLYSNNLPLGLDDSSIPAGVKAGIYGMGFAVGDYDHDLDLDYYITNIGANLFHQNQGDETFVEVAASAGVLGDSVGPAMSTGWGTFFIDYDNDGWQDLFCANGHINMIPIFENTERDPDRLWRNNGNGTFTEVGYAEGLGDSSSARGASFCDFDQDGDLDLFVSIVSGDTLLPDRALFYRNEIANPGHWLEVRLEGVVSNRDAFGARMEIAVNGMHWAHEVMSASSHESQNSSIAHFGLGSATTVDSLWIYWPSGIVKLYTNLPTDTLLNIAEDTTTTYRHPDQLEAIEIYPNPTSGSFFVDLTQVTAHEVTVEVMDLQGRILQHVYVHPRSEKKIQFQSLRKGFYLVRVSTANGQLTRKIVVE